MAETSGLIFCMDESMGRPLADVLRRLRAPGSPRIHDLREFGLSGVTDEVMMQAIKQQGVNVLVTCDSRILVATVRRDIWRAAGLSLFVLDGKWGNLRLFEQARRLMWWWPILAAQAGAGPQGSAWRVPSDLHESGMRQMFVEPTVAVASALGHST